MHITEETRICLSPTLKFYNLYSSHSCISTSIRPVVGFLSHFTCDTCPNRPWKQSLAQPWPVGPGTKRLHRVSKRLSSKCPPCGQGGVAADSSEQNERMGPLQPVTNNHHQRYRHVGRTPVVATTPLCLCFTTWCLSVCSPIKR